MVDAEGLVLAPGFIDMHSHADFTLPSYPDAINSLGAGRDDRSASAIAAIRPHRSPATPALAAEQRAAGQASGRIWTGRGGSFGEYLDRLDKARPAINCVASRWARDAADGRRRRRGSSGDARPSSTACARRRRPPWRTAHGA